MKRNGEVVQEKTKTHTVYKTIDGCRVSGVTSILRVLDKPALVKWAWSLGNAGIEVESYRDDLAGVGRLVHAMILQHFDASRKFNEAEYSPIDHDRASNSFIKFLDWEKTHGPVPALIETPLVSEQFLFGGTPDFYGTVNGVKTLVDYKSGKGVYQEAYYQMAAYLHLLKFGHALDGQAPLDLDVEQVIILNIGRSEKEDTQEVVIRRPMEDEWRIFQACREIYESQKIIKRAS